MSSLAYKWNWKGILVQAAWFGLLAGLVEGAGLLALQATEVNVRILWIAPLFAFLLFVLLGIPVYLFTALVSKLRDWPVSVVAFSFVAFLDWILLTQRITLKGSIALALGIAVVLARLHLRKPELLPSVARRTLPSLAALTILIFLGVDGARWLKEKTQTANLKPPPAAPNIVIVVMDAVRADHLSVYGYSRPTTPNLEQLAARGVVFQNAFSTSDWTLPAHASLLSGLYPLEHGARIGTFELSVLRLPEVLLGHGYRTAAVSANLFWFTPEHGFGSGFIHFEGVFHSVEDMVSRTSFGRATVSFVKNRWGLRDIPGRRRGSEVTRAALDWIDRDSGKPFFLVMNYLDAHSPYRPPQPFRSKFSSKKEPGGLLYGRILSQKPQLTAEQLQDEIDAYDGAISYIDDQIGSFLGELRKRGLQDNTIVIVTSDHGELLGEHGLFTHRVALYYQGIHVPLFVSWPNQIPSGIQVSRPVSIAWLPSTLLDLAPFNQGHAFPGPSLAEAWRDPAKVQQWPSPVQELARMPFAQFAWVPAYSGSAQSIVTPTWHLILHEKLGGHLFDWVHDPAEEHDLFGTPEGRELAGRLSEELIHERHRGPERNSQ